MRRHYKSGGASALVGIDTMRGESDIEGLRPFEAAPAHGPIATIEAQLNDSGHGAVAQRLQTGVPPI